MCIRCSDWVLFLPTNQDYDFANVLNYCDLCAIVIDGRTKFYSNKLMLLQYSVCQIGNTSYEVKNTRVKIF